MAVLGGLVELFVQFEELVSTVLLEMTEWGDEEDVPDM